MTTGEWFPLQLLLIAILLICIMMVKFAPPKDDPYVPMPLPNYDFERIDK